MNNISFESLLDTIQKILTILAILIGAIWTYFNYFRGRTYRPRLENDVCGNVIQIDNSLLLNVKIKIKNVGLSKIDIKQKGSGLRIIALKKPSEVKKVVKYEGTRLKTVPIFQDHGWIEPNEPITDVHTFLLPNNDYFGLKFEVRIITKKISWVFSSIQEINTNNGGRNV